MAKPEWKDTLADPTAHDFCDSPNLAADECARCGQPPEAHTGANIPVDQQLRRLPERTVPRFFYGGWRNI